MTRSYNSRKGYLPKQACGKDWLMHKHKGWRKEKSKYERDALIVEW